MPRPKKRIEHDEIVLRFARRLREMRLSRGMTQLDLARKADVSTAYVGRLERGRAAPGIDLVARLADALGASAADLEPAAQLPETIGVLREQVRELFDGLVRSDDEAMLSFLAQSLARLSDAGSTN